jgi:signal transduction histidine kinase
VGFDKKKISQKSLGLYIMRKRVKDINAALNIDSKIGRGTKITVKL